MKRVAVLGSTGSIGTQTLDVIAKNGGKLKVSSLVAFSDKEKLSRQRKAFRPEYSALISEEGSKCLLRAVENCDVAVVATRGTVALEAVLYCLDNGIDVALANKEILVAAGKMVMPRQTEYARIIPVDSEHSAILQCMKGETEPPVKLLLTASGGPFWDVPEDSLRSVTAADALKHPSWNMGKKITVDSATMMNKAFEVIEACRLFGIDADQVEIVVHRQSVVHSMAEFADGTVIAQMSRPDMRLPIQYALLDGKRADSGFGRLNLSLLGGLTFFPCDFKKFPCANFGYEAEKAPPLVSAVINAANDVCVDNFLEGRLLFTEFRNTIQRAVSHFEKQAAENELTVDTLSSIDAETRVFTNAMINGDKC